MQGSQLPGTAEPSGSRRLVCRCLRVMESEVVEAIATFGLRTVDDVCRHTGAGDGCTACRRHLSKYLSQSGPGPSIDPRESASCVTNQLPAPLEE